MKCKKRILLLALLLFSTVLIGGMNVQAKKKTKPSSSSVLDGQMSLFPHFLPAAQTASASGMKEKTGEKREVSDT